MTPSGVRTGSGTRELQMGSRSLFPEASLGELNSLKTGPTQYAPDSPEITTQKRHLPHSNTSEFSHDFAKAGQGNSRYILYRQP